MQASIRMRLLKLPGRNSGSRLEAQAFWMMSISTFGSKRVHIAHSTWSRLAGVDVLVDHHRPLAGIGAALAGARDMQRTGANGRDSAGWIWITVKRVAGPGLVVPHAEDCPARRRPRARARFAPRPRCP